MAKASKTALKKAAPKKAPKKAAPKKVAAKKAAPAARKTAQSLLNPQQRAAITRRKNRAVKTQQEREKQIQELNQAKPATQLLSIPVPPAGTDPSAVLFIYDSTVGEWRQSNSVLEVLQERIKAAEQGYNGKKAEQISAAYNDTAATETYKPGTLSNQTLKSPEVRAPFEILEELGSVAIDNNETLSTLRRLSGRVRGGDFGPMPEFGPSETLIQQLESLLNFLRQQRNALGEVTSSLNEVL